MRGEPQYSRRQAQAAYAKVGRRYIAGLIDLVLVGLPFSILLAGLYFSHAIGGVALQLVGYLPLLALVIYEGLLVTLWHGQTVGKRIMRVRVVALNAQTVTLSRSFARAGMKLVSGWFLMLGFLWALWDAQHQTWHDKVAMTHVIDA